MGICVISTASLIKIPQIGFNVMGGGADEWTDRNLNSLLRYETLNKIIEFYTEWFSACLHTITKFKTFALLKVVHPLIIYQHTKFHGPILTGANFAYTLEI
jgi:hypothetical protein